MRPRLPLFASGNPSLGQEASGEFGSGQAEPHTCPRCSTRTWSRNVFVVRCRYCNHVWRIER